LAAGVVFAFEDAVLGFDLVLGDDVMLAVF
jgi:hypothetical protein